MGDNEMMLISQTLPSSQAGVSNPLLSFSGVVPAFAQSADLGPPRTECGIGCLMPWNGKLYILNYLSHRGQDGSGTGLRVIDDGFRMERHPDGVDGTYANRFVHYASNQMIIGPHVVDARHEVRTVRKLVNTRICGTAAHLQDPDNLVYMLGMEGELFELNVYTLEATQIFDLTRELDTAGEFGCHFKDCYTAFGRLVVANNDYSESDFLGKSTSGTLAEYDGVKWTVLERKPFVSVRGRGNFTDTIFATGWDRASAILQVYTHSTGRWRRYRLPKASHTHDHKWQSEWPRIREIEHERFLVDLHGMFYELSPWAYEGHVWGIKPISQHLWVLGDYCSWKGMLVMGADNASPAKGKNCLCAEPQSGIWMGKTDDLWQFGKPQGWGGPWWEDEVVADEPSDPYLMTGFDKKVLHLSHGSKETVTFAVEVDFLGNGRWHKLAGVEVAGGGYQPYVFPTGYSAHWMRVRADKPCRATAQLHYS